MRQKGFTPIIILLLIVAVLGAAGYFAYSRGYTNSFLPKPSPIITPRPLLTPLPTPKPTSTPDPTANWKTYTNTTYKYSLKYPSDWEVQGEGGEDPTQAFAPNFSSTCNFNGGDRCANLVISLIGGYKEGENLEYYFNIGSNNDSHIRTQDIISEKDIVVGGEKALEIKYRLPKADIGYENEPAIEIHAVHDNSVLLIQYGEEQKTSFSELKYEDLFNHILSTFKFTQ